MQSPRTSSPRRRRLIQWTQRVLLGAIVVGAVALIVRSMMPKPVPVDLAEAVRSALEVTVDEDGRARVKDRYVVSAPIGGRLARIELDPGEDVERGHPIARLHPHAPSLLDERSKGTARARVAAAEAAKRQAAAQIQRATAAHEFATTEAERHRRLAADDITTQRELDEALMSERSATAQLESARFALRVAEHELQMAKAALGHLDRGRGEQELLVVPAPVTGRVLKVIQESEGVVLPGAPLLELGDPAALEVVVDVLTRDAVRMRPGAKVRIDRWGGAPLAGRVRRVDPSAFTRLSALGVEEQRVNVIIDLVDPRAKWRALGDGYRVEAHVTVWSSDDALTVPASAVFRSGDRWVVYEVVDGVAHQTEIELGHRTDRRVEIVGGLEAGAVVVVHPSDKIGTGVAVVERQR